jgi:hypothetical protein
MLPDGREYAYQAGLKHKPATANPPEIRALAHRIEESWPLGGAA